MSEFEQAQIDVHTLSKKPANEHLLVLYSHFKQATVGDVRGSRPGILMVTKRLKYDAWTKLRGMSREDAEAGYIAKVKSLLRADGKL